MNRKPKNQKTGSVRHAKGKRAAGRIKAQAVGGAQETSLAESGDAEARVRETPSGEEFQVLADDIARLVRVARENPYHFFNFWEVAKMCGFGLNVMTALNSLGAPVVGRKCNPQLLIDWIGRNADRIGKMRG